MVNEKQRETCRTAALKMLDQAGIVLTGAEISRLEFADFGLDDIEQSGLIIITYVNTSRVCAKEMILLPGMTCPEHRHPEVNGRPGKEETFRCRRGLVYLYVEGEPAAAPRAVAPKGHEAYYRVWHEIVLQPGEQFTLQPDTPHWFQAGPEGAVISEFSTTSFDEFDIFTDPAIARIP